MDKELIRIIKETVQPTSGPHSDQYEDKMNTITNNDEFKKHVALSAAYDHLLDTMSKAGELASTGGFPTMSDWRQMKNLAKYHLEAAHRVIDQVIPEISPGDREDIINDAKYDGLHKN